MELSRGWHPIYKQNTKGKECSLKMWEWIQGLPEHLFYEISVLRTFHGSCQIHTFLEQVKKNTCLNYIFGDDKGTNLYWLLWEVFILLLLPMKTFEYTQLQYISAAKIFSRFLLPAKIEQVFEKLKCTFWWRKLISFMIHGIYNYFDQLL